MNKEMITLFKESLRQLERDMGWQFKNETECCGVSTAQCQTLLQIAKQKETSIVELAANLGLDTSTLSRTINNLVNQGLVHRVLKPEDRRYVLVTLSEEGKRVCSVIERSLIAHVERIFALIPEAKQAQVLESFTLLADAIAQLQCCTGIQKLR